jgi:adenosine deaminase
MPESDSPPACEPSILLVSLGLSPAIVPEAFLLPGGEFFEVHVLTTETGQAGDFLRDWFAAEAPDVLLTITAVADFRDLRSEVDHFRFEEVLYRWWLEKSAGRVPHVCLSGGFKTMSSAVQRAAEVFGAREVFHVLADARYPDGKGGMRPAATAEEIAESYRNAAFHWIRLGPEPGWPQLRGLRASDYPLTWDPERIKASCETASEHSLRTHLNTLNERTRNAVGAWDRLADLPFPILATWPPQALEWLNESVDPDGDADWIRGLPKVELHCHLGGFATHGAMLGRVRAAAANPEALRSGSPPAMPADWPLPSKPTSLEDYMKLGDAGGSAVLCDPGCLREQCRLLYEHLLAENVVYAEIRCSPANYARAGRSPWAVLEAIKQSFDEAMAAHGGICRVNLLLIATRRESGDFRAAISRHLALAVSAAEHWNDDNACRVVGVDLAGFEDPTTRAHYFREEFSGIHRCGLALTVHAGENDDAEGIWRAVFDLNARRLGHALHLIDSAELLRSVADRGITVEMCPFANLQIKGFPPMAQQTRTYPLKQYLDAGVRVTVNTDNIGISAAGLSENFALAARMCPDLTRLDVLRLIAHAVDAAFVSAAGRTTLRRTVESLLRLPGGSSPQRDEDRGARKAY